MKTEKYIHQQSQLPDKGKYIIANYDLETITVYQAFNEKIAKYAVENQKFGGGNYSFDRMTWIKPNFMWMMYRSGWAKKENQEKILALKIKKEGFKNLLQKAVISSFKPELYKSKEIWKTALSSSEVRLQWDPDHNPIGKKLNRKAIQIGIKGETLKQFNDGWITQIEDITAFVRTQSQNIQSDLIVPFERVLTFNKHQEIIKQVALDWKPWHIFIEFIVDNEQKFIELQHIFNELKSDKLKNDLNSEDIKWEKLFSSKFWSKHQEEPRYYESLVEAYSSGEYEFLSCDYVSENTAKLICNTWSVPYGGFEPLEELITNFEFKIVDEWH